MTARVLTLPLGPASRGKRKPPHRSISVAVMENLALTQRRVAGELIFDTRYNHSGVRLTVTPDRFAAA